MALKQFPINLIQNK